MPPLVEAVQVGARFVHGGVGPGKAAVHHLEEGEDNNEGDDCKPDLCGERGEEEGAASINTSVIDMCDRAEGVEDERGDEVDERIALLVDGKGGCANITLTCRVAARHSSPARAAVHIVDESGERGVRAVEEGERGAAEAEEMLELAQVVDGDAVKGALRRLVGVGAGEDGRRTGWVGSAKTAGASITVQQRRRRPSSSRAGCESARRARRRRKRARSGMVVHWVWGEDASL